VFTHYYLHLDTLCLSRLPTNLSLSEALLFFFLYQLSSAYSNPEPISSWRPPQPLRPRRQPSELEMTWMERKYMHDVVAGHLLTCCCSWTYLEKNVDNVMNKLQEGLDMKTYM
jgi:hypothetical protein